MEYAVDLHGMKAQEAETYLQRCVDSCFCQGYTSIRVICGHGFVLRSMAMEFLSKDPLVKNWSWSDDGGSAVVTLEENHK